MTSSGRIRSFDDEEGWGVIESPDTPGGCWVHFSAWSAQESVFPRVGAPFAFIYEEGPQDGYDFRALEAWPQDADPVRPPNDLER